MRKIGTLILGIIPTLIFGQGLISSDPNSLITVGQSGTINPNLKIGIGTSTPTDNLHIKGSVRMESLLQNNNLNQVLVKDSTGLVSYRDASTLGSGSGADDDWTRVSPTLVATYNNTDRIAIGNAGISGSSKLQIFHDDPSANADAFSIRGQAPSYLLAFRIDNEGKAGIRKSLTIGNSLGAGKINDAVLAAFRPTSSSFSRVVDFGKEQNGTPVSYFQIDQNGDATFDRGGNGASVQIGGYNGVQATNVALSVSNSDNASFPITARFKSNLDYTPDPTQHHSLLNVLGDGRIKVGNMAAVTQVQSAKVLIRGGEVDHYTGADEQWNDNIFAIEAPLYDDADHTYNPSSTRIRQVFVVDNNGKTFIAQDDGVSLSGDEGIPNTMLTSLNATTLNVLGDITSGPLSQWSDRRIKKDIVRLDQSLEKLTRLNGYSYKYNEKAAFTTTDKKYLGLIAQEVQREFPELVQEGGDGHLTLDYIGLIPVLIEAIKEQQVEIDALKNNQLQRKELPEVEGAVKTIEGPVNWVAAAPNPFNSVTSIKYSIDEACFDCSLIVRNMHGEIVVKEALKNAEGAVQVDLSSKANGFYTYGIMNNGYEFDTKVMIKSGGGK